MKPKGCVDDPDLVACVDDLAFAGADDPLTPLRNEIMPFYATKGIDFRSHRKNYDPLIVVISTSTSIGVYPKTKGESRGESMVNRYESII